jgi:hypothetical protein
MLTDLLPVSLHHGAAIFDVLAAGASAVKEPIYGPVWV